MFLLVVTTQKTTIYRYENAQLLQEKTAIFILTAVRTSNPTYFRRIRSSVHFDDWLQTGRMGFNVLSTPVRNVFEFQLAPVNKEFANKY
jgi:hypothetical protein